MFIVIREHCQSRYEDAEWPAEGWTETAGQGNKCWTFEKEADAQQLATYMNSPHYDDSAWRCGGEWVWVVMPFAQFQELVPDRNGFEPVPDYINAQVTERMQEARRTNSGMSNETAIPIEKGDEND